MPHSWEDGTKLALSLGPTQLFVACSTEKRGEPGIFSHVRMTQSTNGKKNSERKSEVSRIVQPTASSVLSVYNSCPPIARYVWQVLPGTLALLAVLSPSAPTLNYM